MRSNCLPDSGVRIQNMCMWDVYLVVVPEPFSVSQSWGGGVTGNLQNNKYDFKCVDLAPDTSTL